MFTKIFNIWFNRKNNIDFKFYDHIVDEVYYDEFLHALYRGEVDVADKILKEHYIPLNLNIDFYDETGKLYRKFTPMHAAVLGKSIEAVKYLIDNGFDINNIDGYNKRPIDYAKMFKYKKLIDLLEKHINISLEEDNDYHIEF